VQDRFYRRWALKQVLVAQGQHQFSAGAVDGDHLNRIGY
jgi:hypothetical protein